MMEVPSVSAVNSVGIIDTWRHPQVVQEQQQQDWHRALYLLPLQIIVATLKRLYSRVINQPVSALGLTCSSTDETGRALMRNCGPLRTPAVAVVAP